jgi:branched-subunit amino acid transport protein
MTPTNQLLYILVAGVLMTVVWRFAGLALSSGLKEDSPVFRWVGFVSTALVSGLISRLVIFSPGALADINMLTRLAAFAIGVLIFFVARRHLGIGVLAGVASLLALGFLTS